MSFDYSNSVHPLKSKEVGFSVNYPFLICRDINKNWGRVYLRMVYVIMLMELCLRECMLAMKLETKWNFPFL